MQERLVVLLKLFDHHGLKCFKLAADIARGFFKSISFQEMSQDNNIGSLSTFRAVSLEPTPREAPKVPIFELRF